MGIAHKACVMENTARLITATTMMNIQLNVLQKTSVGQIKAASRKSKIKHQTSQRQSLVFSRIPVGLFLRVFFPVTVPSTWSSFSESQKLVCQTHNSAISWGVREETAVKFSKRPCVHMESRETSLASPCSGPLTGRLYTAEVSCSLQSCWEWIEVRRHGNQLTVLTGTFLVSLRSRMSKIYKNKAEVLPALCL